MLRLIRFLFTGSWHEHNWKVIHQGTLGSHGRVTGYRHILQCTHCGKVTHKDSI